MRPPLSASFSGEKPPFTGDDAAMRVWLAHMLTCRTSKLLRQQSAHYGRHNERATMLEIAKHQWRKGNPDPLRELYPEIADCISKQRSRAKPKGLLHAREKHAYDAAKVIRALWREHYGTDRRKPDAAWFAAQIWSLKPDDVRNHKPRGNKSRPK